MSDMMVRVTGQRAQLAVREGDVAGEVYSDGEVWAEIASLTDFYRRHPEVDKRDVPA